MVFLWSFSLAFSLHLASKERWADLSCFSSAEYQTCCGRIVTVFMNDGAWLSSVFSSTDVKSLNKTVWLSLIEFWDRAEVRSALNLSPSILLHFLTLISLTASLTLDVVRVERIRLWSATMSQTFTWWTRESPSLVITRSRVCPDLWVGSWTCWFRWSEQSKSEKIFAWRSLTSSMWMLKSPTINSLVVTVS